MRHTTHFQSLIAIVFCTFSLHAFAARKAPHDEVLFSSKKIVHKNQAELSPRGLSFLPFEHVAKGVFRLKVSGTQRLKNGAVSDIPVSSFSNPCNKPRAKRFALLNPDFICEPNWSLTASDVTPNDTYWSILKGLHQTNNVDIDAPAAWSMTTGSSSVVVGVIDTGIDYNHNDLAANVWTNSGEIAGNGIDDDHNGYVDDIHGINAITNTGNPLDDNGHGTHVSGTIGAVGNNGIGVAGVAWNVKLVGLKFLSSSGSGSTSDAVKAIDYLTNLKTQKGLSVIASNNSWGGGGYSSSLQSAIVRAKDAGILFVAAAGNSTQNLDTTPSYPASINVDNVISVAAMNVDTGGIASFSNYGGSTVSIAAPGTSIASTYPGNSYVYMQGTSMACPHVTGVLALMKAANGNLTYGQYRSLLLSSASTRSSLNGYVINSKFLNAANAVSAAIGQSTPTPTPTATPTSSPTPAPTSTPDPSPSASPTPDPDNGGGDDNGGLPTSVSLSSLTEGLRFTATVDQASTTYWMEFLFGSKSCGVVETSSLKIKGKIPTGISKKYGSLTVTIYDPSDQSELLSTRKTIRRAGNARAKSLSQLCRDLERTLTASN